MKLKKLISILVAGLMAMSTVNVVIAEDAQADKIVYSNDFETANPFTYSHYNATSEGTAELSTEQAYGGSTQSLKANFWYLDRMSLNLNELGADLDPGKLYELSVYAYNVGASNVFFDTHTDTKKQTSVGGTWRTHQKVQLSQTKKEWIETKFYFIYDEKIPYINIYDEAGGGNHVVYFDNLAIKEIGIADEFLTNYFATSGANVKRATNATIDLTSVASLDVSETENVIAVGESTDVIAYTQTLDGNTTMDDVIADRVKVATNTLTVTSDDTSVVKYENGKLVGVGVGTATVTVTDGTNSQTMLMSVHGVGANGADISSLTWPYVSNPMNSEKIARASVSTNVSTDNRNLVSTVSPLEPAVIHMTRYFGTKPTSSNTAIALIYLGNKYIMFDATANRFQISSYLSYTVNAGLNDFDIVVDYPSTTEKYNQGYMNVTIYLNGISLGSGEVQITDASNGIYFWDWAYANNTTMGDIYTEMEIVSLKPTLSVKSVDLPAAGETLSTLDDIDIEFTMNNLTAPKEAFSLTSAYGTTEVYPAVSDSKVSLKPIGGLKANTDYTLTVDASKISASGISGTGTTTYTFTTDATDVSAVVGNGYALVNSQIDMIENNNYINHDAVNSSLANNELIYTGCIPNQENSPMFTFAADDTFVKNENVDRYVINFDTKRITQYPEVHGRLDFSKYAVKVGNNNLVTLAYGYEHAYDTKKIIFSDNTSANSSISTVVTNPDNSYMNVQIILNVISSDDTNIVFKPKAVVTFEDNTQVTSEFANNVTISKGDISLYTYTDIRGTNCVPTSNTVYIKNVNMYASVVQEAQAADYVVSAITVEDSDSAPIIALSGLNGKIVNVKYSLTNNALKESQPYAAISAIYEKGTNKLIGVDVQQGTVTKGDTAPITNKIDMTEYKTGEYVLKVFIWDGFDTATPIEKNVITPLN